MKLNLNGRRRGSIHATFLPAQADPNPYPEELDMDQLRKRLETDPSGVAGQMRGHVPWLSRLYSAWQDEKMVGRASNGWAVGALFTAGFVGQGHGDQNQLQPERW